MKTMTAPAGPTQTQEEIGSMFDRIAGRYDLLNRLLSAGQDRRWRAQLASLVPYAAGGLYLDVATGTGDVLFEAARKRSEYAHFLGVDISEQMLAQAKRKASKKGFSQTLEFQRMGAQRLELRDACVDCLSIAFGFRNVILQTQALDEFARVLKPGGTLLLLEFFEVKNRFVAQVFRFYFQRILPRIGGFLSDKKAYEYLPRSVERFMSSAQLSELMHTRGLIVEDEISYLMGGCKLLRARRSNEHVSS